MSSPVCVPCCREMEPAKNGVWWVKMQSGKPYKITNCDRWACPYCGQQILTGFANTSTTSEDPHFDALLASAGEYDEVIYER